jgi:CheY-like chemotaxis protein
MSALSAKKILVVDDEASTLEMARISFELMSGWKVLLAASATDGLAIARNNQPDAILVELKMRHDDGPAILRKLLAEEATRDIPVILLTERFAPGERRNFDESGVAGLIWKPFHAMDLPRQVAMLLGWRP